MNPKHLFSVEDGITLFALEGLDFALRVDPWGGHPLLVLEVQRGALVLVGQVDGPQLLVLGHKVALGADKLVVLVDVQVELPSLVAVERAYVTLEEHLTVVLKIQNYILKKVVISNYY